MFDSKWSEHATVRLIELTKTQPSLWTRAVIEDDEPDEELHRIAEILSDFQPTNCRFSAAEVHTHMRYLAKNYLRTMEQMRCEISADLDVKPPTWKFFKYLSFLEHIYGDRKNSSMAHFRDDNRRGEILGDLITLSETESEHEMGEEVALEGGVQLAQWNDENKVRLIKEYEKQPRLWCPSHPDFIKPMTHDGNQLRKELLLKITAAMNVGEKVHFRHDQIKKMIGSIRQYYRACLKTGNATQWPLFHNTKFLGNTVFEFVRKKKDKENNAGNNAKVTRKRKILTDIKKDEAENKRKKFKKPNLNKSYNSDSAYYLWNDAASMRLIEAYKAHPKLWCPSHPGFLRRKEHMKRSREIAEIVDYVNSMLEKPFSQKQVRMQMNNFRRCYRNCLKAENTNGIDNPGWRFYEHMKFLGNSAHDSWPRKAESSMKEKKQRKLLQSIKPSDVENIGTPRLNRSNMDRKPTILQKRIFLKRLMASRQSRLAPVTPKIILTTAKWGSDGQLHLIKEYEKSPCLWDPTHPAYINPYGARVNKLGRGRELAKIAAALSRLLQRTFTAPEVKARIIGLRLAYRKHYEEAIRTGEEPKWRLYKHLKFLGSSVVSLADRRKNKKEMLKQTEASCSHYFQRLDRQESPELEEFIVEKSQESPKEISQAAETVSTIFADPVEWQSSCSNLREAQNDARDSQSQKLTPDSSPPLRSTTSAAIAEPTHCSPLLPVESIKRSLSFHEESEDADDELTSTQSKRGPLVNIEEQEEIVSNSARREISQSPENVDSFYSSRLSSPRSITQLFPGLWSTPKDTKFCASSLITAQGPSFSSEAVVAPSNYSQLTANPSVCSKKTPEMDKCDKLGVIVASTLKRISTNNPDRLKESIKIIKEALFNAEYEDFSSI